MAAIRKACCGRGDKSLNRLRLKLSASKDISSVACLSQFHSLCRVQHVNFNLNLFRNTLPSLTVNIKQIHSSRKNDKQDYYKVLGVDKTANQKEIKSSYYKLAKKYHPDVSNNDESSAKKFKEISEAYEVLGDENKRNQYDTFGMTGGGAGGGPQGAGGFGGFESYQSQVDPEMFWNMFKDFGFSGFESQQFESKWGTAPASELHMNLTFEEACRGVNKEAEMNVVEECWQCKGTRAAPGVKPQTCPQCHGTGMETVSTGIYVMRNTCRMCGGQKTIIKKKCNVCTGKGKLLRRRSIVIPVPAGIEDGQTVRINVNKQEVFVTFKVGKSRIFRREGADVHSEATITISQAVLGGTIRVPGIYDDILLNIPAGTQSHDKLKLSSKGISRVNSYGYGDHFVSFKIKVPLHLTAEQKALMLCYAETERNVDGTINGIVDTNKESGKAESFTSGKQSVGEKVSDESDNDESLLGKIKRKLFG
ncbi:protein tumorous imaginal discs, mitochondrial-like isoform X2 [Ruditapes philippinarum]|uniref:protein tumorous imaginal discs, mitochondrial-like isoform X2 n=1 Tax=Ruditapes philippinarum TaxID=129788 RepID=UPI00295BA78E|nr:protein tumorous imaginal discs, mitochondrial-like isoform X2 [Ruditapes philippinarum]